MRSRVIAAAIVGAILCCGAVHADTVTLNYTLDYTDGGYFVPPDVIIDHWPYFRGSWEDWGWTHDLVTVPSNATGIASATLSIAAWDVNVLEGELDVIYIDGVQVGVLDETGPYQWKTTTFDVPESVLDDLWADGELYVSLDIDWDNTGHRVTLGESILSVTYITGTIPEPATVGLLGLGALVALKRRRSRVA